MEYRSIHIECAGMYWSSAYSHFVSNSGIVIRRLVVGLRERDSLSTEGRAYCHSLTWDSSMTSLAKAWRIFWVFLALAASRFCQTLIQYHCSFILRENKKFDKCTLHVWPPSVTAGSWRGLKISKHAQEGWCHIPLEGFCPSSISFGGKNKVV